MLRPANSLPRDVWVLTLIAFLVMVGYGVVFPVLPVFARSFGVSTFATGALVSAFAFTKLVTSPWCNRLIQAIGARTAIGLGSGVVAASSAACGLAQNYWQLLLARGAAGVGSAFFSVSALSLLLASAPPERRGRASALFSGGFLLGGMVGPAAGGLLTGISIRAPFFFYALTLTLAVIVALVLLETRDGRRDLRRGPRLPLGQIVRKPAFQVACGVSFTAGWQAQGARATLVPILVVETLHRPESAAGMVFAIAAVAQALAVTQTGRMTDVWGRKPVMASGLALAALATVGISLATSVPWLVVAMCLFGVAAAELNTSATALIGDVTGGRGGTPVALYQMCQDLGAIIGPLAVGALADHYPLWAAFGIGAVIMLAVSLAALVIPFPPVDHGEISEGTSLEA